MGPFLLWLRTLFGPCLPPHLRNSRTFDFFVILCCNMHFNGSFYWLVDIIIFSQRAQFWVRDSNMAPTLEEKIKIRATLDLIDLIFMGASVSKHKCSRVQTNTAAASVVGVCLTSLSALRLAPRHKRASSNISQTGRIFFWYAPPYVVCVFVCRGGSEVTAVGEGPMSCGCSLASRLLCLSHYRVEAQHSLKAFTWLQTHAHARTHPHINTLTDSHFFS